MTQEGSNHCCLKLSEPDEDRWLDYDDSLSEQDKSLIEARIDAHERNPDAAIPWDDFKARLSRKIGR
jgi:putative addiction module component (TIGR02574 family)